MFTVDDTTLSILKILSVFILVFANGFFVAAEFSLVAVRRSRVAELVAQKRTNAAALHKTLDNLDANLAATQLGITISSLALGWIGEPALAHLIEPLLQILPGTWALTGSHVIAIIISFAIITTLHIVLGELAPKSLALQRSELTALWVVRPLNVFLFLLKPAIVFLNGLGNWLLRRVGLNGESGEGSLHSAEELKLLVAASGEAGLLHEAQQEVANRIFNLGDRSISDCMTPRPEIIWIDADDTEEDILESIRECRHEQLVVSRGSVDNVIGVVGKRDMLDQILDKKKLDPLALVQEVPFIHESLPVLKVFERFKERPTRMAVVVNEYGTIEGIVTQADLLEAIAGDIAIEDEEPEVTVREDGSLLMDGMMPVDEAFDVLQLGEKPEDGDFHTLAGFALYKLGRIPAAGDYFDWNGWRFEIIDMDGMRIDKLLLKQFQKN
ncbi:hemolysin family protein [Microvirga sp. W0021]|uniref:Hemolysin family protein n=1 Tax=Hohaiivirga grylli TaxID=3133970 RepID=A0ABV0BJM8_9HYPH